MSNRSRCIDFTMYVAYTYSKRTDIDLDELHFHLFEKSSSNELRALTPFKDALLQHLFRCAHQAVWIWGNTLLQRNPPPLESWGWRIHQGLLRLNWKSLDIHNDLQMTVNICQCRTNKCSNCKCAKNYQKCLKFCDCGRKCGNT